MQQSLSQQLLAAVRSVMLESLARQYVVLGDYSNWEGVEHEV